MMSLPQQVSQTTPKFTRKSAPTSTPASARLWQVALWTAQILLCLLFGMAGVMKTFMAPQDMVSMGMAWAPDFPLWLVRFIGLCELAGAIGIILPALTRIMPFLTPLAALGFLTIQVLAVGFHAIRGEIGAATSLNALLFGLSLFVLWGRTRKLPVQPRV